ncbi:MAG TPA: hypothetical protein VEJ63_10875 [Planctomycetota bacterium]|nr:hypothetical protein [Planctomycetota bacterium]
MRRTLMTFALAAAISVVVSESTHRAATTRTEDFADLLKLADCVVEVNISALKHEPTSSLGIPRSVATLKVLRCYKGTLEAAVEIQCETFGGASGESTIVMPGQAKLETGTKALLLLTKAGDIWRVLAGEAGHVDLHRDQNNVEVAQRANGSFEFYIRDEQSLSGYSAVKKDALSAEQLRKLVDLIVTTGRNVFEDTAISRAISTAAPVVGKAMIHSQPTETPASSGFPIGRIALIVGLTSLAWLAIRRRG